jgi:primosomal protein N' (replication factor Y)
MDLDTTRTRRSYEGLIEDFENRKIDILIGTQMVSKGLDFDHVRLVGILNADNMLNFPDFRSWERSFQLIAQVSGRAGRKNKQGKVIIQTSNTGNIVIKKITENDYKGFFMQQLAERKNFKYPPFFRLVKLTLRHKQLPKVSKAARLLADELRKTLGNRVVGPEFPLINRVFNYHQKCIIVKIERDKQFSERRRIMRESIDKIIIRDEFKGIQIVPDVDPYN